MAQGLQAMRHTAKRTFDSSPLPLTQVHVQVQGRALSSSVVPHRLKGSPSGSSSQQASVLMTLFTGPMQMYRVFSSCPAYGTVSAVHPLADTTHTEWQELQLLLALSLAGE
jgi:hypothetical protein